MMNASTIDQPLISIIVPVFNAEAYIVECIESIIAQTYTNLEIILVNDGSTDKSLQIIQRFIDQRIHIIDSVNQGVSVARNLGLEYSSGAFIFFLDADDLIPSNAISKLTASQKNTNADLIISGFQNIGHKAQKKTTLVFEKNTSLTTEDIIEYTKKYLSKPNKNSLFVFSWGRLFSRAVFKENNCKFNSQLSSFEDVHFNYETLKSIETIHYVPEPLYYYRNHRVAASATTRASNNPHRLFGFISALEAVVTYLSLREVAQQEIEHLHGKAVTVYTIIQLIRLCANLSSSSFPLVYRYIYQLSRNKHVSTCFEHYRPGPGESKLIPFFLRHKLPLLTILVCYIKARKRYR